VVRGIEQRPLSYDASSRGFAIDPASRRAQGDMRRFEARRP